MVAVAYPVSTNGLLGSRDRLMFLINSILFFAVAVDEPSTAVLPAVTLVGASGAATNNRAINITVANTKRIAGTADHLGDENNDGRLLSISGLSFPQVPMAKPKAAMPKQP